MLAPKLGFVTLLSFNNLSFFEKLIKNLSNVLLIKFLMNLWFLFDFLYFICHNANKSLRQKACKMLAPKLGLSLCLLFPTKTSKKKSKLSFLNVWLLKFRGIYDFCWIFFTLFAIKPTNLPGKKPTKIWRQKLVLSLCLLLIAKTS